MRVFVTGASGLIGSRLFQALGARDDEVIGLSRTDRSQHPGITWVQGSASDLSEWEAVISSCDAVVNLAGAPVAVRWTKASMGEIVRSRVGITTALFHAMSHAASKPRVMVSASAIGFYGTDADATFDEASEAGAGFLAKVCREWEAAASRSEELGVRVVRLRIGMVLAADGGALPKLAGPIRAFVGGALGDGKQWVSWIHVDDLVALILACIDDEHYRGAVNGVAPEPVTQRDLVGAIGDVLRRPVWLDAPAFFLRVGLGKMADEMLTSGQRVLPAKAEKHGFEYRFPTVDAALEAELGVK